MRQLFMIVTTTLMALMGMTAVGSVHADDDWAPAELVSFDAAFGELPSDQISQFSDIHCPASGECVAVGDRYSTSATSNQGFIATMTNGQWGDAQPVDLSDVLSQIPEGERGTGNNLKTVTCSGVGECVALGTFSRYRTVDGALTLNPDSVTYSVTMVSGVWQPATVIDFSAVADQPVGAGQQTHNPTAVSCTSTGVCIAGGTYQDSSFAERAFVMSMVDGAWGAAASLDVSSIGNSTADSIAALSCPASGDCHGTARLTINGKTHAAALRVSSGSVTVTEITNDGSLLPDAADSFGWHFGNLSCSTGDDCVAAGHFEYQGMYGMEQLAVSVSLVDGTWSEPVAIPFPDGATRTGRADQIKAVDCTSVGSCVAVGRVKDNDEKAYGFTTIMESGSWTTARLSTTGSLSVDLPGYAPGLFLLSCPSADSCVAAGEYTVDGWNQVVTQQLSGEGWSDLRPVQFDAGTVINDNTGYGIASALSCADISQCVLGGGYRTPANSMFGELFTQVLAGAPAASNDATLSSLSTSTGSLVPAFSPDVTAYSVDVANNTSALTVTPTVSDAAATVTVNGTAVDSGVASAAIDLAVGSNTLTIVVTAEDESSSTVTVTVSRAAAPSEPPPSSTTEPSTTTAPASTTTVPVTAETSTTATTTTTTVAVTTSTSIVPVPERQAILNLDVAAEGLVDNPDLAAGGLVSVTFDGFTPGELVMLVVASEPQLVASGTADDEGSVTLSGSLPMELGSGSHTLAVYAPESGVGYRQSITVAEAVLPATGSGLGVSTAIVLMLAAGAAITVLTRRHAR